MVVDNILPFNKDADSGMGDAKLRVAAASILVERLQWMRQAGITFGGKRDLYKNFGYERILSVWDYRDRYARNGIAKRIVETPAKATWRGGVKLIESPDKKTDTPLESEWAIFQRRLKVTSTLLKVDILSRLSTYSVLFIGATGDVNTELPKGDGTTKGIKYLSPFCGAGGPGYSDKNQPGAQYVDATIKEFEEDATSERFGLPKTYRLRRTDFSAPALQKDVHWSRIIHVAEDALDDNVYGIPALEAPWNLLDDLEKVTGGGAEAFYQRANRGRQFNIDPAVKDLTEPQKRDFAKQIEELEHGITRNIRTRGVDVKEFGSDVADFNNPADAILTQLSGTTSIPKRLLTGSEMGELASSQDRDNWRDQVNGRRESHAEPNILFAFVQRLMDYNYLPLVEDYSAEWGSVLNRTDEEKQKGAKSWADTSTKEGPSFTRDEIRHEWYGMEPLTEEQKAEIIKNQPPPRIPGALPGQAIGPGVPRAAEGFDAETLILLEEAIKTNQIEVIEAITGLSILGGVGSGNFGHSGRPGERGGSDSLGAADAADAFHVSLDAGEALTSIQKTPAGCTVTVKSFTEQDGRHIELTAKKSFDHVVKSKNDAVDLMRDALESEEVKLSQRVIRDTSDLHDVSKHYQLGQVISKLQGTHGDDWLGAMGALHKIGYTSKDVLDAEPDVLKKIYKGMTKH